MLFFVIFCIVGSCILCPWLIIVYICFPIIMGFVASAEQYNQSMKRLKEREERRKKRNLR